MLLFCIKSQQLKLFPRKSSRGSCARKIPREEKNLFIFRDVFLFCSAEKESYKRFNFLS